MIITNTMNLPNAFENIAKTVYQYQDKRYSVTSLLDSTRACILKRRYHGEIQQDVSEMIWLLFGQAVHRLLDNHSPDDDTETKIEYTLDNGYTLSAIYDHYTDGIVTDYKTCSVWKVIYKNFEDWEKQLSCNAWLLAKNGKPCKKGRIVAIIKDHNKKDAKYKPDYPQLPVVTIDFDIDLQATEEWIYKRFDEIIAAENLPDNELPLCSLEERYNSGDKFAVMEKGKKIAIRVLNTSEEAEKYLKDYIEKKNIDLDKFYIETRKGEDKKCLEYCTVKEFCNYGRNL